MLSTARDKREKKSLNFVDKMCNFYGTVSLCGGGGVCIDRVSNEHDTLTLGSALRQTVLYQLHFHKLRRRGLPLEGYRKNGCIVAKNYVDSK